MTYNDKTIRTVALAGHRFDSTDGPGAALIQPNAVGGVCVRISAPVGAHGAAFTIDFADVNLFCDALSAAALEAGEELVQSMFSAEAACVIERARTA